MEADDDQLREPPLAEWASTLPALAADVVTDADLTRPHLYIVATASSFRLAGLRSRLSRWADELGLHAEEREDIVMAVDEALSNVVKHAFEEEPGTVVLFAARDSLARVVHVVVSDNGSWRTMPGEPGAHGRGLHMMDRLADVFDLHHDDDGTTVVLRWSLPTDD